MTSAVIASGISQGRGEEQAVELGRTTVKILIVDDDLEYRVLLGEVFDGPEYDVRSVADGVAALEAARSLDPDLVVLDLGMPHMDGVEVCRELRLFSDAYVIILTASDEEVDMLLSLSVGADEFLTKPVSPRELLARVKSMLRRPRHIGDEEAATRCFGDLSIDVEGRDVTVGDQEVGLTKIEFDLLDRLSSRPNVVFSREMLLRGVWGDGWIGDGHVVDVHIATLRRKLGDDVHHPRFVRTVRGVGYRMACPDRNKGGRRARDVVDRPRG